MLLLIPLKKCKIQQIKIKLIILVKIKKQKLIITKRNKKIVRIKPTVGFGREDIKIESNIIHDMNWIEDEM